MKKHLTRILSLLFFGLGVPVSAAPATFTQATKDYRDGNFRQALAEFEELKAVYPSNLQIHYYEALCYQGLGRLEQARVEYAYVAKTNSSLKTMAQAALAQLSKTQHSGGGDSQGTMASLPDGKTIIASATKKTPGEYKVRKVLEFYADW